MSEVTEVVAEQQKSPRQIARELAAAEKQARLDRSARLICGRADLKAGRDTPEAREALEALDRVAKSQVSNNPKLSRDIARYREEPAKVRKKGRKKAKARSAPPVHAIADHPDALVPDETVDESGNRVQVLQRGVSMRGLESHQIGAFQRFETDWHAAFQDGLRGASWKEKVDGSGAGSSAHMRRLRAQERMRTLRSAIGDRDFVLLEARIIYGYGPAALHKAGGESIDAITSQIKLALNKVSEFYGRPRRIDRTLKAAMQLVAAAEREADSGRPA